MADREREERYGRGRRTGTCTHARRAGSVSEIQRICSRAGASRKKNATGTVNFARAGEHVTIQD